MATLAYPYSVRDSTNTTTDNRKTGLVPTVSNGKTLAASPATVLASNVTFVEIGSGDYIFLYDPEANLDASFPLDWGSGLTNPNDRYGTLILTRDSGRVLTALPNAAPGAADGLPALDGSAHLLVFSVNQAVTLPSIPANWITASGINAGALAGKGDWLLASGYTAPDNSDIAALVASVGTGLGTLVAAVKAKTDNLPAGFPGNFATLAIDGSGRTILQPSGLDAIVIEAGINARQALSPILAACAGTTTGPVPGIAGTFVAKNPAGATTRITTSVDPDGYRISTTLNLPA